MNNFEYINNLSKDELAEWLLKNGVIDNAPWDNWFLHKYCENCESVDLAEITGHFTEEAFCEHNKGCRFFDHQLSPLEVIKLWLNSLIE